MILSPPNRLQGGIVSTLVFALLVATVAVGLTLSRMKQDRAALVLSEAAAKLKAQAKRTGQLPSLPEFLAENPTLEDPFGSVLGYFYDARLETGHICSYEAGGLILRFCLDNDCRSWRDITDVAATIYSAGPDETTSLPTGRISPPATIVIPNDNDDILSWITQAELRLSYACPPPPKIANTSLPPAVEDSTYFAPIKIEGGKKPYRLNLVFDQMPDGLELSLDPSSYAIKGFINVYPGEKGSLPECRLIYPLRAMVIDAYGLADVQPLALVVTPAPLSFSTKALPRVKAGKPFRLGLSVKGGNGAKTFALVKGPSWLQIDHKTGLLSGIPPKAGIYSFVVKVADKCDSKTEEFILTVDAECPKACQNSTNSNCQVEIVNTNFARSFFFKTPSDSCQEIPPGKRLIINTSCLEKVMLYGRARCYAAPLLEIIPAEGWRQIVCGQNCRPY